MFSAGALDHLGFLILWISLAIRTRINFRKPRFKVSELLRDVPRALRVLIYVLLAHGLISFVELLVLGGGGQQGNPRDPGSYCILHVYDQRTEVDQAEFLRQAA